MRGAEQVRHRNGRPDDNGRENLELVVKIKGRSRSRGGIDADALCCANCGAPWLDSFPGARKGEPS